MARVYLRLSHRLIRQSNFSSQKILSRSLTSATSRLSSSPITTPPSRLPRPSNSSPTNTIPDLCLGAGGKAPGFVQQMLFSAPVQEKNAKGILEKIDIF